MNSQMGKHNSSVWNLTANYLEWNVRDEVKYFVLSYKFHVDNEYHDSYVAGSIHDCTS